MVGVVGNIGNTRAFYHDDQIHGFLLFPSARRRRETRRELFALLPMPRFVCRCQRSALQPSFCSHKESPHVPAFDLSVVTVSNRCLVRIAWLAGVSLDPGEARRSSASAD